jgi:hypothetical protein
LLGLLGLLGLLVRGLLGLHGLHGLLLGLLGLLVCSPPRKNQFAPALSPGFCAFSAFSRPAAPILN